MVMRYAHHHPEDLRAVVTKFDEYQKNSVTNLLQSDSLENTAKTE